MFAYKSQYQHKKYKCKVCSKEDRRGRLKGHVLKYHVSFDRVPFLCSLYNFRSTDKVELMGNIKNNERHVDEVQKTRIQNLSSILNYSDNPVDVEQFIGEVQKPEAVQLDTSIFDPQVAEPVLPDWLLEDMDPTAFLVTPTDVVNTPDSFVTRLVSDQNLTRDNSTKTSTAICPVTEAAANLSQLLPPLTQTISSITNWLPLLASPLPIQPFNTATQPAQDTTPLQDEVNILPNLLGLDTSDPLLTEENGDGDKTTSNNDEATTRTNEVLGDILKEMKDHSREVHSLHRTLRDVVVELRNVSRAIKDQGSHSKPTSSIRSYHTKRPRFFESDEENRLKFTVSKPKK